MITIRNKIMTQGRKPYVLKTVSNAVSSEFRRDDSFVFSKDIKDWQTSKKAVSKNKANKKRLKK
jgi:hypothetical protein